MIITWAVDVSTEPRPYLGFKPEAGRLRVAWLGPEACSGVIVWPGNLQDGATDAGISCLVLDEEQESGCFKAISQRWRKRRFYRWPMIETSRCLNAKRRFDHTHLLLEAESGTRLSCLMKLLKGRSAYEVFHSFPELKLDAGVNSSGKPASSTERYRLRRSRRSGVTFAHRTNGWRSSSASVLPMPRVLTRSMVAFSARHRNRLSLVRGAGLALTADFRRAYTGLQPTGAGF